MKHCLVVDDSSVIRKVASWKFAPQVPKTKPRKTSVNEIGKPTKIENSIAPSMIRPMVGFSSPNPPPKAAMNQSSNGTVFGR